MKFIKFFILAALFFSAKNIEGQTLLKPLPFLEEVEVHSNVNTYEAGILQFYYFIHNGQNSTGRIFQFEIDIAYYGTQIPDTSSLYRSDTFENRSFKRIYPRIKGKIVPVGFLEIPQRWNAIITSSLKLNFGGYPLIEPGDSLGSFMYVTKGLPTIREVIVKSQFNVDDYFPSIDDSVESFTFSEMDSLKKKTYFFSKTLGPWLPDSSLSLGSFTDTLETFRFRSCEELEWATDASVCSELETQLSEVKSELVSQDSLSAANALKEFINLVEVEKEASLTSEGYALLYFNAQYLAEWLSEKEATDSE